MSAACVWTGKSRPSSRTAPRTTSAPTPTLQTVSPPSAGEAVEANNFFAEVATALRRHPDQSVELDHHFKNHFYGTIRIEVGTLYSRSRTVYRILAS